MKYEELRNKIKFDFEGVGHIMVDEDEGQFMLVCTNSENMFGKNLITPYSWGLVKEIKKSVDFMEGDRKIERVFEAIFDGETHRFFEYASVDDGDDDSSLIMWYIEIPKEWTETE